MNALVSLLVAAGGAGAITPMVVALLARRKTSADAEAVKATATDTATKTYLSLIAPLEKRIGDQDKRIAELERRERIQDDLLAQHSAWDRIATRALADAGVVIGVAPPLYPSDAA